MKITVRFWRRKPNLEPDYRRRIERYFEGNCAKECMDALTNYRRMHNLAEYTELEIINVED